MYVEMDFLLSLIKPDDWLGECATEIYDERSDELWTSDYTLLELMSVAYREIWTSNGPSPMRSN